MAQPAVPLGATGKDSFGPPEIGPDEIELKDQLGGGAFGTVYIGRCRAIDVAVKVPNSRMKITQRQLEAFTAEVKIMSKIYHPNVALFMGACTSSTDKIRIVTEVLAGDVEKLVFDLKKDVSLHTRMKMAKDAAQGMAWLHGMQPTCLHRDFKISNLLYDKGGTVKVCDFGLSQLFDQGTSLQDATSRPKGTPLYMAPEVWLGKPFNEKADVYSFGVSIWEMMMRQQAYSHHNSLQTFKRAITVDKERPPIPPGTLPSLKKLLEDCWADEPNDRPLFPEIVDRLALLVIETAIAYDPRAFAFWRDTWPSKEEVPWTTFYPAFYALLGLSPPQDDYFTATANEHVLNLRCLRALAVTRSERTNDEVVTLLRFGDLMGFFGPVGATPVPDDTPLDRMRHMMSATFDASGDCYFHGWVAVEDADNRLLTQPPGTFLVRFSSNSAHPTWFTISKVQHRQGKASVVSIRVEHEPGSAWRINVGREHHEFRTLMDLIISDFSRTTLALSKACPGSPFQHLFSAGAIEQSGYVMDNDVLAEE